MTKRLSNPRRPGGAIPVVAVRPDGQPAGFFDAIIDAARHCGVSYRGVRDCLRGRRKTCHGLKWYHADDFKALFFAHSEKLRFTPDPDRSPDGTFRKGSAAHLGYRWSEEQRRAQSRKIKEAYASGRLRATGHGNGGANAIPVVELETRRSWPSARECAAAVGLSPSAVCRLMRLGRRSRVTNCHYWRESEYERIFPNK